MSWKCGRWVVGISVIVVGLSLDVLGQGVSFQGLGFISAPDRPIVSGAYAISEDGATVVGYTGDLIGANSNFGGNDVENGVAFRWTNSNGMIGLGDLPGGMFLSEGRAVSADGTVIGGASHVENTNNANPRVSFRWTQSTGMTSIGIAGPGGSDERVEDISDDGSVMVGKGHRQGYWPVAYKWTPSGGMNLFLGLAPPSAATAVSGDGNIIGGYIMPDVVNADNWSGRSEPFVWSQSGGLTPIDDLIVGADNILLTIEFSRFYAVCM